MMLVGTLEKDEVIEMNTIVRNFELACRFRELGKLARKKRVKKRSKK